MSKKTGSWYQYSGAIHMHTTESDGTKTLHEVVAIGRQAGLDFMMFSDHMGLTNRDAGLEGLYGDTLVVIGYEHNDVDDNNHFLVFGSREVYPADATAQEYVALARDEGVLGILAHPDEIRSREGRYPPYPWTAWDTDKYDGLELWNQMSEWMERLTPLNKLAMAFSPRKSMIGPTDRVLKLWDDLNRKRKYVGIGGVDAHAFPIDVGPFTVEIFPYKVHFRCLRTHILLNEPMSRDFDTARDQLYDALRDCRVFISNMRWGAADRFEFYAVRGAEQITCGGEISDWQGSTITVKLPTKAVIRLICDGEAIVTTKSDRLEYQVARPGLYRVEAWKGRRGWIFSNHMRIGVPEQKDS
ncbi:MAG: histidinol-phosphatase [candidate division Zixibacteria bacterium]|nr:histidinol-phosphatase [candidate division Zixibacteria bacterium]